MTDNADDATQEAAMREALANAVMGWQLVEENLARLIAYWLNRETGKSSFSNEDMVGFAVFYKPNNTETRIGIVDAVTRFYLRHPFPEGEYLLAIWERLLSKLNKIKERRNEIVHGTVAIYERGHGPTYMRRIRLSHAAFDVMRHFKQGHSQMPGKSPHDVQQVADNFRKWATAIKDFRALVIRAHDLAGLAGDDNFRAQQEALRQKVLRLALDLKVTLPQ